MRLSLRLLPAAILPAVLLAGTPPDAGLDLTFLFPAPVTGATIDVTSAPYNATPGNAADDDAVAINAAIAAASAGDEVYIPDGIYNIDSRIEAASGVSIRGQSETGTIIRAGYSVTGQKTLIVPAGDADITISSMTLDSDGAEAPRFAMEIGLNSGSLTERIHVRDVTIDTFRERGIIVRTGRHVRIQDCTIRNATALGGGGEGYGITIQQPGSDNNWVSGCEIGPVIRHGILLQFSTHHNLIEYNTLDQNTEDAIDLHGEDEYSNEVRFNTITNGARSGIGIGNTGSTHDKSGPNNWIHDNFINGCLDGIEIVEGTDDVFVENNDIRFCTNYGVRIDNFDVVGDPLENISLTGNTILDCDRGIYVAVEAPNLVVFDNDVTDNDSYGISTHSSVTGYSITFNDFSCNGTAAILGSATGTYANNEELGPCALPVQLDAFQVH